MHKVLLSYNPIDADGLHKILKQYEGRHHEELITGLEAAAAQHLGKVATVAVSSGTAALHLALAALNIQPGDFVAVPTFAYVGVVNPILYVGAIPVWIDAEAATWNLDPDLLAKALQRYRKIKAIIAVHNYGVPAQMKKILALARTHRIPVIEDAAEAWGATCQGKPCGTLGDLGFFSFNSNKTVTAFGGGLVTTKSKRLANRMRLLASQARLPKPYYEFNEVGFNYRMSPLIAAYALLHLQQSHHRVSARQQIFTTYCEVFKNQPAVSWVNPIPGDQASRWLPAFRFTSRGQRTNILKQFNQYGIETRPGWNPLHTMQHLSDYPALLNTLSDQLFREVLCLPCTDGVEQVVSVLQKVISG